MIKKCTFIIIISSFLLSAEAAWYNTGWAYRAKITVEHSKVGETLTDYPVYVNLNNFGSGHGIWGHALSTGNDLRITKSDGTTEVPIQVVAIDTTAKTGEMHFKGAGTDINATTNASYYLYYGNGDASAYAASATYGSQNVWNSDYKCVYHFQEAVNNDASGYKDSTSNTNHGTGVSMSITAPDGKLSGKSAELDGSADYIDITTIIGEVSANTVGEVSMWLYADSAAALQDPWNIDNSSGWGAAGQLNTIGGMRAFVGNGLGTGADTDIVAVGSVTASVWQNWAYVQDGTSEKIFMNGTSLSVTGVNSTEWFDGITIDRAYIGTRFDHNAFFYNGKIDEMRISSLNHSANWRTTEYKNQSSPSTFYTIATEENAPATANAINFGVLF